MSIWLVRGDHAHIVFLVLPAGLPRHSLHANYECSTSRSWDAIIELRSDHDGQPGSDPTKYECAGSSRRSVRLGAGFALTRAGAELAEKARSTRPSSFRRPSGVQRRMPIGYIVEDTPDDCTRSSGYSSGSLEGGCYDAAVKIVLRMISTAQANDYPEVIRIRSYSNEQPAPASTDFGCEREMLTPIDHPDRLACESKVASLHALA